MRRLSILLSLVLTAVTLGAVAPAQAVTDGTLDNGGHPYVGLMLAQDENGDPLWRCTGTLIAEDLFLTAGHCTEDPAAHVEIWFDDGPILTDDRFDRDAETGGCADVTSKGYPCIGDAGGTPFTHPDYDPDAFYLFDLGIVVLDDPVTDRGFAALPSEGQLDQYRAGKKNGTLFTSVGYGLQRSFPDAAGWKNEAAKTRYVAHPRLIQINNKRIGDFAVILSNNARTGGTCFGDSGGPNFIGTTNVIGGVTSFGNNPTCGGQGGVYLSLIHI